MGSGWSSTHGPKFQLNWRCSFLRTSLQGYVAYHFGNVNTWLFLQLLCAALMSFRKIQINTGSVPVWSTTHRNQEVSTWHPLTKHKGTCYSLFYIILYDWKTTTVKSTKRYSTKCWSTKQPVVSHVILKLARGLWSTGSVPKEGQLEVPLKQPLVWAGSPQMSRSTAAELWLRCSPSAPLCAPRAVHSTWGGWCRTQSKCSHWGIGLTPCMKPTPKLSD